MKEKVLSYRETIDLLVRLQNINREAGDLLEDVDFLKTEIESDRKRYEIKKKQYEKNLPYLKKVEKEHSDLEREINEFKEEIQKNEEKKKRIKTIKEFKAINKEMESLYRQSAFKENEFLNRVDDLEYKRGKIKVLEEQLKTVETALKVKEKELEGITKERKELIEEKMREKADLEKELPLELVRRFNRIYKGRKKTAIVSLKDQVCQGCYIKLPLQEKINIQKEEELSFCPYCSRILYVEQEVLDVGKKSA